jgi:hypothetical protein
MGMTRESLSALIEQTRAEVAELARVKTAAWDLAPGNHDMQHVFLTAHGFHTRWHQWEEARLRLLKLEKQLAQLEAA